jgi:integrase
MKHSFFLRKPKSDKKTLILFTCYFKKELKKFVYSTGENIVPLHWSKENKAPKMKGSVKDKDSTSINMQINRYSEAFEDLVNRCKITGIQLTSDLLKSHFDDTFKKSSSKKDLFFDTYDAFMIEKQKRKEWKPATVKRYKNIKNHLEEFEKKIDYKLTFNAINERFYTDFTDYCYNTLDHYTNTFARNIGLFKTFMYWAFDNKITYNDAFKKFKKPIRVVTKEEALSLEQIEEIFNFDCNSSKLEKARDIFIFQCFTGLRYGELKSINKRVVINGILFIKEDKDVTKPPREIPLFSVSKFILKKYDYQLPLITNQKQNDYIKELLKAMKWSNDVEYSRTKNKEKETIIKPFHDRISTHTARRSFITVMKNKGIADKTIMSMTGHKDIKTFNMYHKVDNIAREDAVQEAFGTIEVPKLKVV